MIGCIWKLSAPLQGLAYCILRYIRYIFCCFYALRPKGGMVSGAISSSLET